MTSGGPSREWKGEGGRFVRLWPEHERDGKHVSVVQYSTGAATFADTYKHRPEAEARFDYLVHLYVNVAS